MSNNGWNKWVGVVGRLLLASVFVFSQTAWAGQNQQTKDKTDSLQKTAVQQAGEKQSAAATTAKAQSSQAQGQESENSVAEEKSPGDGRHEGIKVHGHWTIEVRNPDGSVATHREFENSLVTVGAFGGSNLLSQLLSRQVSLGTWIVGIDGSPGPCLPGGGATNCDFIEPGPSLTVSANLSGSGGTLILSGIATAAQTGNISSVNTFVNTCSPGITPASACNTFISKFTGTVASASNPGFSAPIPVQANQTIAVTVVISFS